MDLHLIPLRKTQEKEKRTEPAQSPRLGFATDLNLKCQHLSIRGGQTCWSLELSMLASVYGVWGWGWIDPLEPRTWNASISLSERDRPIGVWNLKCQHWSLQKGEIHWSLEHFLQLGGPFPTSSSRRSGLNYSLCLSSNAVSYRGNKDYWSLRHPSWLPVCGYKSKN